MFPDDEGTRRLGRGGVGSGTEPVFLWEMRPLPATQAASLCPRVSGSAWWAGNVWHPELDAPCQLLTVAGGPLFRGPGCTSACVIMKGHLCATLGALAFRWTDTAGIFLWGPENMMNGPRPSRKPAGELVSCHSRCRSTEEGGLFWHAKRQAQACAVPSKHCQNALQQNLGQWRQCALSQCRGSRWHSLTHRLGEHVLLQNVLNLEIKTIAEGNIKVGTCCTAITASLTPGGLLSCLLEVIPWPSSPKAIWASTKTLKWPAHRLAYSSAFVVSLGRKWFWKKRVRSKQMLHEICYVNHGWWNDGFSGMALKALAEWGVALSHVACGKEGLILELGEIFWGCRKGKAKERPSQYLSGDWQVIMFYWSRNISGLIYSFTHLG